ncbi:MAG: flagellar motor protein [Betaproteobacteria bacterium CG2_30_59_46]|nr:MAG: flagellar motor protein [Betaproteobacteria bacterium CG2_30_59_46]PIQ12706.1 MAG: flagellar motor protein [Hydrogenophilales bacterium CG18_big_fil_WC_8_21_14_2_50_58_12]PIY00593.1 MAG: flagellar motor protein [Hydrogenophilales bacterium CG_4_10_14_3_um_filter_58_23]PJB06947.1 MAG: flagellar motor protein [Hydrogenophilales bacterium CG_4_9_14_3_um_filter_59_35]
MDLVSIFGILLALTAIIGGQVLEGGHIGSLLQLTAFVIVLGGTTGAIMLQSSPKIFFEGMRLAKWIIWPPKADPQLLIEQMLKWSNLARKGGLLALEPQLDELQDAFTKKGLQMLVDGAEPEKIRTALEVEISTYEKHHLDASKVWQAAGGYAPTIGILGAVLGLIHVMENLSDPAKLGGGIAVAFVATVYGVGSANLFFLPMSNKLRYLIEQEVVMREMLIEGLVSIANGENPRVIESKLQGYII